MLRWLLTLSFSFEDAAVTMSELAIKQEWIIRCAAARMRCDSVDIGRRSTSLEVMLAGSDVWTARVVVEISVV